MLAYLDTQAAIGQLLLTGEYDDRTIPSASQIEMTLTILEAYLDDWLGYRAALSEYAEVLQTDNRGVVTLSNFPVVSVSSVNFLQPSMLGTSSIIVPDYAVSFSHEKASTVICCIYYETIEVKYTAGYDPLPQVFKIAMFQALKSAVSNGVHKTGDIGFLSQPSRDVQSLNIPALSKSWRISQPKTEGETMGDRLFSLLSNYRRRYTF